MAGGKWRVLVVDDEEDLRELIRLTLSFDDRIEVVDVVSSAADAVAALRASTVDLVVLDNCLGGVETGVEVASTIRACSPDTKVLLFTAVDGVHVDLTPSDGSVHAVLGKPDLERLPDVAVGVMGEG